MAVEVNGESQNLYQMLKNLFAISAHTKARLEELCYSVA